MRSLASLLAGITFVDPDMDCEIQGLSTDSRQVKAGDLFMAYPGGSVDGRDFIEQAIQAGAAAILAEENERLNIENINASLLKKIIFVQAKNIQQKIGQIASRFYENPSRKMHVVGVTGTNGKTSIAYLLAEAINHLTAKNACVYFGTLGTGFPQKLQETTHTTLDPVHLQQSLSEFPNKHVSHVAMEVSSHALDQGRVASIEFETAVFTNLTRDHLDYHQTMEAYGMAKARLFKQFGLKSAVINVDDAFGQQLYDGLPKDVFGLKYSLNDPSADLYASNLSITNNGMQMQINTPWGEGVLKTSLVGRFNVYNLLAVVGVLGLSYPFNTILACLEKISPVPGRMQCITAESRINDVSQSNTPFLIIDYAHTPDALEQVLKTARELAKMTKGSLWCVFGCGGDRDQGKRSEMGKIAEQLADHIIITNDNPRSENPEKIAKEIFLGMKSAEPHSEKQKTIQIILDREQAIKTAFQAACSDSESIKNIVVIAGKGHEQYQIIGAQRAFFSDEAICRSLCNIK